MREPEQGPGLFQRETLDDVKRRDTGERAVGDLAKASLRAALPNVETEGSAVKDRNRIRVPACQDEPGVACRLEEVPSSTLEVEKGRLRTEALGGLPERMQERAVSRDGFRPRRQGEAGRQELLSRARRSGRLGFPALSDGAQPGDDGLESIDSGPELLVLVLPRPPAGHLGLQTRDPLVEGRHPEALAPLAAGGHGAGDLHLRQPTGNGLYPLEKPLLPELTPLLDLHQTFREGQAPPPGRGLQLSRPPLQRVEEADDGGIPDHLSRREDLESAQEERLQEPGPRPRGENGCVEELVRHDEIGRGKLGELGVRCGFRCERGVATLEKALLFLDQGGRSFKQIGQVSRPSRSEVTAWRLRSDEAGNRKVRPITRGPARHLKSTSSLHFGIMRNRARTLSSTAQGPRVGIWGRFDLPALGDLLHPRVFEAELRRRLPGARVLTWAPLGTQQPLAVDGGLAPASLGTATPERLAELAASMDALVIGGGELVAAQDAFLASGYGLGSEEATARGLSRFFLEAVGDRPSCPVAWNAVGVPLPFTPAEALRVRSAVAPVRYLAVPDEASRRHLASAGVEDRVTVVPSPLLLSSRVYPPELLGRRRAALRRVGALPAEGPFILIEAGGNPGSARRELLAAVASLAARNGKAVVFLDEPTGAEDWATPATGLPASASLADRLAAIEGSTCVFSVSAGTLLVASSFGVACGFLDPTGETYPACLREPGYEELGIELLTLSSREAIDRLFGRGRRDSLPTGLDRRLERHFDRLAEIVSHAGPPRETETRIENWRKAYEAISGHLAVQRLRLAERLEAAGAAFAEAAARKDEAERARDLLAARVVSLETSLAESEAGVLRAREEAGLLGSRLASATGETVRLRMDLDASKTKESFSRTCILDLEERLARERTARERFEADAERLASSLARQTTEAARLADLEAGSRALSAALSSRLRAVEEDAARWRLEADGLLRARTSERDATRAELAWRRP